jgi:3-oxoacyl-[acyl-carrier protein] reductase
MEKNALILGATGGIGEAIAVSLAKKGYNIGIHYGSNEVKAEHILEMLNDFNVKATLVQADVADEEEMVRGIKDFENQIGNIDVIVNTAGIMRLSPISDLDMNEFDQIIRTNLRGTFVVAKLATQHLKRGGVLINFSTSITRLQFVEYGAYAAAKAAIETLTPILAKELRGKQIRVNTIAPGPTATPLFLEGKSDELIQTLSLANPLERLGTPEDIAEAVNSVIGSKWVNGQVIFVNGGMA